MMEQLDKTMKKSDQLMYQMIPKAVAERLKAGEKPINTCQVQSWVRGSSGQIKRG
jgi:guanylate cyclase